MDKIEEELRLKYGRSLVPREEIQNKLNELTSQGYICVEDIKYVIPMTVDDFVYYINDLRRNFLYSDYEFKDFDSFREPFNSFIDDLKERTQMILSENETRGSSVKKTSITDESELRRRKTDILLSILKSYVQYEKARCGNGTMRWCLAVIFIALVLLPFCYTPEPF